MGELTPCRQIRTIGRKSHCSATPRPRRTGVVTLKKANLAISVAQTTSLYGRLDENIRQTVLDTRVAAAKGARVVFFPELSLVGYDLSALADPRLWVAGTRCSPGTSAIYSAG